jgi:mannose-6-phosphate isomerase-like protein (cupin superfamily)/CDGSH-type Zn-finger protein
VSDHDPEQPTIARYKPYYCELKKDQTYLWCACGRSKSQPFCDSSHRGTSFRPVRYVAREDGEEKLFCGCKHTGDRPWCDGAHNNLKDKYDEDDPTSPHNQAIPEVTATSDGKARLDGGCFVCSISQLSLEEEGTLRFGPVISSADGAVYQSQFYFEAGTGDSPVVGFGDRHVILLVIRGKGTIDISGRDFAVAPNQGVYLRPNEAFRIRNPDSEETITVLAAVCPQAERPEWASGVPENFDRAHPKRVVEIDPAEQQAMADRFFQLLVDKKIGSDVVTQFIGEIPVSKAMPHRHLYEESLVVIKGQGFMWTESKKAPVKAGDVIFLPRKQLHSLQCTGPEGMMVAGVIYPGDNPSINY